MDKVALLTAAERSELFRESAARRGMSPAVIEKDFWVCWVLKQLFAEPSFNERIVFKGGSSLSKVFGLIDRFSEDIDLVLDWRLLGYGAGMEDPRQELDSLTKRDRFSKAVNRKAAEYIAGTLIHDLTRLMARCPQVSAAVDVIDPHSVNISYPASFSVDYIRPKVVLEIGPLASWVPSASHSIRPCAAEEFPQLFAEPECQVIATSAERTFWEKATILHQQAHRTFDPDHFWPAGGHWLTAQRPSPEKGEFRRKGRNRSIRDGSPRQETEQNRLEMYVETGDNLQTSARQIASTNGRSG